MPVAFTAPGRLSLTLTPLTLTHKIRIPVSLSLPLTSPVNFGLRNPAGNVVLASVAAQNMWTLLRPLYSAATQPPTYTVEQNFSGIFVPVESAALVGVGTNASANQAAFLGILSYKDVIGHRLRLYIPESAIGNLYHLTVAQSGVATQAFINNVLAAVNPSDIGNWAVSRGNAVIKTFSFITGSANKRFRRKLNLV